MPLPKIAVFFGAALVVVGVWAYIASGPSASPTALIPAFIGVLLAGCGAIAHKGDDARRHTMHAASAIALLGVLGSAGQLIAQPAAGSPNAGIATRAGILLLLLCGVFLALAIRSFVEARRSRS